MKKLDERIKDARCPDCGSPSVSHPSDDPVVWCRDMSNGQRHGWIKSLLDAVLAVGEDSMGEDGRMTNQDEDHNRIAASKDEWVDRCFRRYLACGITNEHKARLWADARWHLLGGDLSKSPEDAADEDLASW